MRWLWFPCPSKRSFYDDHKFKWTFQLNYIFNSLWQRRQKRNFVRANEINSRGAWTFSVIFPHNLFLSCKTNIPYEYKVPYRITLLPSQHTTKIAANNEQQSLPAPQQCCQWNTIQPHWYSRSCTQSAIRFSHARKPEWCKEWWYRYSCLLL